MIKEECGTWVNGVFYPKNFTPVIKRVPVVELWFVYDPDDGYNEYTSEEEARQAYLNAIQGYRDVANEGWPDEVGSVVWGKVYQTTELQTVEPPAGLLEDDPDYYDGMEFAEAFAIERRK